MPAMRAEDNCTSLGFQQKVNGRKRHHAYIDSINTTDSIEGYARVPRLELLVSHVPVSGIPTSKDWNQTNVDLETKEYSSDGLQRGAGG